MSVGSDMEGGSSAKPQVGRRDGGHMRHGRDIMRQATCLRRVAASMHRTHDARRGRLAGLRHLMPRQGTPFQQTRGTDGDARICGD